MEDAEIISLLFQRSEDGIRAIETKYSKLYRSILKGILGEGEDAEECANDLLLAIWNAIPPDSPEYFPSYLCRVARNIALNRYKRNRRLKRDVGVTVLLDELEECTPQFIDSADEFERLADSDVIKRSIDKLMSSLDAESRVLFIRRYVLGETVKELSVRFKLRERYISVKMHRVKERLRKILEEEGTYV